MQVGDRALRVRRRLKDRPLLIGKHFQPRRQVRRMIRPRLQLRDDSQIGAQEAAAEFGHIS